MFSVRTHRRRPARRVSLSFDCLQARITPSDVTGMGDAMSGPTIPDDVWTSVMVMSLPGSTDTDNSMPIEIGTMTLPTAIF